MNLIVLLILIYDSYPNLYRLFINKYGNFFNLRNIKNNEVISYFNKNDYLNIIIPKNILSLNNKNNYDLCIDDKDYIINKEIDIFPYFIFDK